MEANELFDSYRELYFEGGTSSVYLWDLDNGFAGCFLIKKSSFLVSFYHSSHSPQMWKEIALSARVAGTASMSWKLLKHQPRKLLINSLQQWCLAWVLGRKKLETQICPALWRARYFRDIVLCDTSIVRGNLQRRSTWEFSFGEYWSSYWRSRKWHEIQPQWTLYPQNTRNCQQHPFHQRWSNPNCFTCRFTLRCCVWSWEGKKGWLWGSLEVDNGSGKA